MCIIDGAVRVTDGEISNVMAIVGQLLLGLPWVSVLLTPFYLAARHYRHLPGSKVVYIPCVCLCIQFTTTTKRGGGGPEQTTNKIEAKNKRRETIKKKKGKKKSRPSL
jgi:hypothetical protein